MLCTVWPSFPISMQRNGTISVRQNDGSARLSWKHLFDSPACIVVSLNVIITSGSDICMCGSFGEGVIPRKRILSWIFSARWEHCGWEPITTDADGTYESVVKHITWQRKQFPRNRLGNEGITLGSIWIRKQAHTTNSVSMENSSPKLPKPNYHLHN